MCPNAKRGIGKGWSSICTLKLTTITDIVHYSLKQHTLIIEWPKKVTINAQSNKKLKSASINLKAFD